MKSLLRKLYIWWCKRRLRKWSRKVEECSTFIGMPGTGKTTFCAYIVNLCVQCDIPVFCNVPIKGAIPFEKEEFGKYDMSKAWIIIDEGSLMYDNRNYEKNFTPQALSYLKLLRHRYNHLLIFSQSIDVDVKFIRMSKAIFQVKRSLIPFTTTIVKISRVMDINKETRKFEDFYDKPNGLLGLFRNFRLFRPLYYKMFDSYEAPELPPLPARDPY